MTEKNEKIKTIAYWIITVLVGGNYLFAGVLYLIGGDEVKAGMGQLGYPYYFPVILGVWKLLGGLALIVPRFPLLKEWAYAGIFFNLTSASISCAVVGMEAMHVITPLIMLVLAGLSWWLRPAHLKVRTA